MVVAPYQTLGEKGWVEGGEIAGLGGRSLDTTEETAGLLTILQLSTPVCFSTPSKEIQ